MKEMKEMKKIIIAAICVIGLVGGSYAATVTWDDGGADSLWSTALNWDTDTVPTSSDDAIITAPNTTALIDNTVSAVASTLDVGHENGPSELHITGGTLAVSGAVRPGYGGGAAGAKAGTINMDGGSVTIGGNLQLGLWGHGIVNMTAGTITVSGWLVSAENAEGQIQLDGGVLDVAVLSPRNNGVMDLNGGTNIYTQYDADWSAYPTVEEAITNGLITAKHGTGTVVVDTTTYSGRTALYAIPEPATIIMLSILGLAVFRFRK